MSEDSTSDTPTEATEDSKPIETPQVPNVCNTSTYNEAESSITKPMTEVESPKENGKKMIVQDNKLLYTNLTAEIQNREVVGLITYSLD